MYYITNQNNQIIAIDPSLLALLELENIDELYREVALENTTFSLSSEDETVTIISAQNEETYNVQKHNLSSMLGDITLIQVEPSSEKSMLIDDDISTFVLEENDDKKSLTEKEELVEDLLNLEIDSEEKISLLDDDLISLKDTVGLSEEDTSILDDLEEDKEESAEEEEISLLLDDTIEHKESTEVEIEEDAALFDLILPNAPEVAIDEIATIEEKKEITTLEDDLSPIVIDIENISQSIGISTDDYNIFLNEYIDSALSFEKDLQSTEESKRSFAINTLSHLSNVLHLPVITEIVTQIENASVDDQDRCIESFYATLARLTTSPLETEEEALLPILEINAELEDKVLSEVEAQAEAVIEITHGFGHINLDDVKSIHFDFQLEEAANDLSLPVELIGEFVNDFITQAHVETQKMLEAYEKGDLETIQKIGHLLKGTSSNLRINALSDTLYEIQFCEDSKTLEALIKNYWGHFLSLETQIQLISH